MVITTDKQDPNIIKIHVNHVKRKLELALVSYQFIGWNAFGIQAMEYIELQEHLKELLISTYRKIEEIEDILINYEKHFNQKLLTHIQSSYLDNQRQFEEKVDELKDLIKKLQNPLPNNQKALFDDLINDILSSFLLNEGLQTDEIKQQFHRKLLQSNLEELGRSNTVKPSCFISYALGLPVDQKRIYQLVADLKLAGVDVKLDIWDNTRGSTEAFIDLIDSVDYILVIGTPGLLVKHLNHPTSGKSPGKINSAYRGNVVADEIERILRRKRNKGNTNHGIINVLLAGEHDKSFPKGLQSLPSTDTDFRLEINYHSSLFNLLKMLKLPAIQTIQSNLEKQYQRINEWDQERIFKLRSNLQEREISNDKIDKQILENLKIEINQINKHKEIFQFLHKKPIKNNTDKLNSNPCALKIASDTTKFLLNTLRKLAKCSEFEKSLREFYHYINKKNFNNKVNTCFISYAWGNLGHEKWVEQFANNLQKAGVHVLLDRRVDAGKSLNDFVAKIYSEETDYVIVVGTHDYLEKYNRGLGYLEKYDRRLDSFDKLELGAAVELRLLDYSINYNRVHGNRVFPVVLEGPADKALPPFMHSNVYVDFSSQDYFDSMLMLLKNIYQISNEDIHFKLIKDKFNQISNLIDQETSSNIARDVVHRYEHELAKDQERILQQAQMRYEKAADISIESENKNNFFRFRKS